MTSVLITGAGGLIGTRVASAAQRAGYAVTCILRNAPPAPGVLERDLRRAMTGVSACDWVFHLAGGYAGSSRRSLKRVDLRIARNLIEWGTECGVKNWVIASAAEVYGRLDGRGTEEDPTRPVIPYGEIKLATEGLFVRMAASIPDCRLVVMRIGEVYGRESRLARELTARLKRGWCPWPGSGRVPVSFVHVDDVAQAFVLAAERAPAGVSIYNVADDEPTTWRFFTGAFAESLGARPPVFLSRPLVNGYVLGHQFASFMACREPILTGHAVRLLTTPKALSNRKIARELGFAPRFANISSGLEDTLHGLSHDAENGEAQGRESRALA